MLMVMMIYLSTIYSCVCPAAITQLLHLTRSTYHLRCCFTTTTSSSTTSKLTHGTVLKITKSGRIADQWRGATLEVALRMNAGSCSDIIDRNG